MFHAINKWIFRRWGWKIEGNYPYDVKKFVIIVVPHTSSWDFPVGLLVRSVLKADIKFVGKASLFRPPFGWLFRSLGGYPVDRSKRNNFVDAVVDIFNREERFALSIAPEGTRHRVDRLKTGFYYIALGAKVPIVRVKFDWGNKIVGFSDPFYPTGDIEADMEEIIAYFRGVQGRVPAYSFGG